MAASHPLQGLLIVGYVVCLVSAITNSQELARYQQLAQYRNYPEELTRAALSPQQQSHILSDVQQHRFLVNTGQRQQNYQPIRPSTQVDYQTIRQPEQAAYKPIGQPQPQIYDQQSYQSFQQQTQTFNNYQPQPQTQNYAFNYQQQPERKPVLLQPTFPKDATTSPPPLAQQPSGNNYRQPSYRPQQPSADNYQQQFENYVVPERQSDYIAQVDPPKNIVPYTPEPQTQKQETPSWILETQPPTPYKTQKPYDAITFGPVGATRATTTPPRFVKYRPKTKPTVETPVTLTSSREDTSQVYIKPDRKKLYDQLVSSQTTPRPKVTSPSPTLARSTTSSPKSEDELLQEELQRQIQAQLSGKDDVFGTLKLTLPGSLTPEQISNLPNLALGDKIEQYQLPTAFPDGTQKLKPASKPSKSKPQVKTIVIQQPTTTVKPPTLLFEELTKGVLPAGADFELIRQTQDGGLEEVGKLKDIPQKKVTFVILEEQPDGSVKVQGVRGNEDGPTETKGEEVDSIIQKIQKGEIRLPPSVKKQPPNNTPDESVASPSYVKHVGKTDPPKRRYTTKIPTVLSTLNSHSGPYQSDKKDSSRLKAKYQSPTRSTFLPTISSSNPKPAPVYKSTTTTTSTPFYVSHYNIDTKPTASANEISSSTRYDQPATGPAVYDSPTTPPLLPTAQTTVYSPPSPVYQATPSPTQYPPLPSIYGNLQSSTQFDFSTPLPAHFSSPAAGSSVLAETLKKNGFFAMAKFLRQSGLETVLNETGPYTLFVPTDRAFRSLLVQLGGPDRAEIKFKENPRLLSGLLLHHVIPGSFKIDSLQDEMTGVSLAGTQLRVNTYDTQDQEWNDVKVTTINGAKVLRDKADVIVPQGIAHGVDRVMFPLPVGDILQTLQADREGRFSRFVRLLRETGVAAMLQGSKTYTVFAPTDTAFPEGEVERLLENRASARALILRHLTPGTLYSAGMLFYQLRDSMSAPNQIQLSKEAGRVKVNNAQVVSRNIPSTNGVIHAVDSLLQS